MNKSTSDDLRPAHVWAALIDANAVTASSEHKRQQRAYEASADNDDVSL